MHMHQDDDNDSNVTIKAKNSIRNQDSTLIPIDNCDDDIDEKELQLTIAVPKYHCFALQNSKLKLQWIFGCEQEKKVAQWVVALNTTINNKSAKEQATEMKEIDGGYNYNYNYNYREREKKCDQPSLNPDKDMTITVESNLACLRYQNFWLKSISVNRTATVLQLKEEICNRIGLSIDKQS